MARDVRELAGAWTKYQRHDFAAPSADLAHYVERYWMVTWDYPEPYRQLIVPYPNVHLTFRDGEATIQGVWTGCQIKVLEGTGSVFGVAFRPGCFRPILGRPVSDITDRTIDGRQVFGAHTPQEAAKETVEHMLRRHRSDPDQKTQAAAHSVAVIASNPSVTRVDEVAQDLGMSVRQMQRMFAEYVGVGPKWVIRRYRLHEVTERVAVGEQIDWARTAADLGYADQAHFVRDFKAMFGETPTHYAARY